MTQKIDYANLHIPQGKNPREYTLEERRAEEYELLRKAGTFRSLHTIQLGQRYGVDPAQITRDRKALQSYLRNSFTKSGILPDLINKKYWALEKAREASDYKSANQIADSILDMTLKLGIIEKVPEKLDVSMKEEILQIVKCKDRKKRITDEYLEH